MEIRKVMVVDDEDDIRTIAEMALESVGGWRVVMANSGAEALEVALQERPDVILLDVMMPRMDGPTTLLRIRENPVLSDTPVIFMTAKVQKREVARYLALGAAGVIAKPFDPMTLPAEIRSLVSV